jgi:hypothetical protein
MKIDLGNNKVVETKYNIGDVVTVYEYGWGKVPEETLFYLDEKDENGHNKTEKRLVQYTIDDIKLSCRSGQYTYSLSYSNKRCMFPCASRNADEEYIIGKVNDCDIYKDPAYGTTD